MFGHLDVLIRWQSLVWRRSGLSIRRGAWNVRHRDERARSGRDAVYAVRDLCCGCCRSEGEGLAGIGALRELDERRGRTSGLA